MSIYPDRVDELCILMLSNDRASLHLDGSSGLAAVLRAAEDMCGK